MAYVVFLGWHPGLKKVSLHQLLHRFANLRLSEAKSLVDDLIGGKGFRLPIPADIAELLAKQVEELGADCLYIPQESIQEDVTQRLLKKYPLPTIELSRT